MQAAQHILMVRPVNFLFNSQTAVNNAFQVNEPIHNLQAQAQKQFDDFVQLLQQNKVDVIVMNDTQDPFTPDSIFPNNWFTTHEDGRICLYPMFAPNRRLERKPHIIDALQKRFHVNAVIDYSFYEAEERFLEGTGSMVLDREHKIAYACLSPRTDVLILNEFCVRMGYKAVSFSASDATNLPVYHTNVMMCVADKYAVICLDSITDEMERGEVEASLKNTGKEVVAITLEQMNSFAGNMLQVQNSDGEKLLVMSSQAYNSLTDSQLQTILHYNKIIHSDISVIETVGGGSARCMMAEVYLKEQEM